MELFSTPWWSALLAIILIDLVLAGDNAIVIALAARNLPPHLQKKAIAWGTFGAIAVRSVMTVGVVWLLKIPGLMLVGGLGLLWIAYKLLADQGDKSHDGPVASTFWVFGSTVVLKLVERFPLIINIGAAVLAFTAAKMIVSEPLLDTLYGGPGSAPASSMLQRAAQWSTYAIAVAGILSAGWWATRRAKAMQPVKIDTGDSGRT